ncbi:hypothetical protein Dimus_008404 [Dionaea muscipula]
MYIKTGSIPHGLKIRRSSPAVRYARPMLLKSGSRQIALMHNHCYSALFTEVAATRMPAATCFYPRVALPKAAVHALPPHAVRGTQLHAARMRPALEKRQTRSAQTQQSLSPPRALSPRAIASCYAVVATAGLSRARAIAMSPLDWCCSREGRCSVHAAAAHAAAAAVGPRASRQQPITRALRRR